MDKIINNYKEELDKYKLLVHHIFTCCYCCNKVISIMFNRIIVIHYSLVAGLRSILIVNIMNLLLYNRYLRIIDHRLRSGLGTEI